MAALKFRAELKPIILYHLVDLLDEVLHLYVHLIITLTDHFADTLGAHGIRMDIYLEDEHRTRYNIEMQCINQKDLEQRIRYYQSGIDRNFLEHSRKYRELPESYVIFICDFDYYKAGLALYERESIVKGTDIRYEDGSHAIILNAMYQTQGTVCRDILEFLDYKIQPGKPTA